MDEDIFPVLCPMKAKKTYSKPFKKSIKAAPQANNVEQTVKSAGMSYDPGVPLTTKVAVEYLLNGKLKTNVCRYCLKVTIGLSELDQIMQIAGTGVMYKVTIRDMIASFYPYKACQDQNFPEKICQRCVDRALNAYLFTQQCEQAERALRNCFDDMNEKLNKLDPIDRPKKRGRQKLNPNFNVLYAEHGKVMDYAEPLRNIINVQTESLSNEPDWNEFECKKCWQVLPNLESLLNHQQIHPKYMWYHCRLCGKSFVKHNQLKKHFNQVHLRGKEANTEVDKTFKCKQCGNATENYIQHLQHIENHKFKSIMKHLIEKKMDQLCLVCLKKSTDLVELDKMVCIHGSCPELVGDKTLYTVLASTLPDQKSYKYQELHVPHKANIMTITKRKRKYKEIQNLPDIPKMQFKLSLPKVVTKDKFKTDDFYYNVFCEPQTEDSIIIAIDHNIAPQDTESPRIAEIIDKEPINFSKDCHVKYMLTDKKEEIGVIGNSSSEDQIPGDGKEPANAVRNCNPVIEMVIGDKESNDLTKRMNVSNEIKGKTVGLLDSNQDDRHEINVQPMDLDKIYNLEDVVVQHGKQTIDITDNFNAKDSLLSEEAMDIVGHCEPEDNIFNETKDLIDLIANDNLKVTIPIDKKCPSDLINLKDRANKAYFKDSKLNMFHFSNPIVVEFDDDLVELYHNIKLDADMASILFFSNPDQCGKSSLEEKDSIKEINIPKCNKGPLKGKTDLTWIFNKFCDKYNRFKVNKVTDNVTNVIAEPKTNEKDCKFCWLFKNLNKCEYCKKPIDKGVKTTDEDNQNIEKNIVTDNIIKNDIEKLTDAPASAVNNLEIQTRPVEIRNYNLKDRANKAYFKDSKLNMFHFSNPIVVEFDDDLVELYHNIKLDADMASILFFSNPDQCGKSSLEEKDSIKEINIPKCNKGPLKGKTDLTWIFNKFCDKYNRFKVNKVTDNVTNVIAEPKTNEKDCKFCWLFKNLNKCEYCKKPIDKGVKTTDEDNQNIEKNIVTDNIIKNDIEKLTDAPASAVNNLEIQTRPVEIRNYTKEQKIENMWQCTVCLTDNNKNRSACYCCESKKYFENGNCKVTFKNNKTFFDTTTHEKENKEEIHIEKEINLPNRETIPLLVIEEASMMDTRNINMQDHIAIQMANIKDTSSTQSMDIEIDSVNYILDTKVTFNEKMDVEEDPFIPNNVQKLDPTSTLAANIVPYVGANIQFNIGSNSRQHEKGARKIKRAVRNMPKAFHK